MTQHGNLISASHIVPGNNDRKVFDSEYLMDLAWSIKTNGLIQPITVRPHVWMDGETERHGFQIIAGERRFRAMTENLGWEAIPCLIEEDMDDETASAIMLAENASREDLNPIEEAEAYQRRVQEFGWDVAKLSDVTGKSKDVVSRRLGLLNLREEIVHLVRYGNMPLGHAEAMTALDRDRQLSAMRVFQAGKDVPPINTFKAVVRSLKDEQDQEALFDLELFFVQRVKSGISLARSGKKAEVDVPKRDDLPSAMVEDIQNSSTAMVIEAFIEKLQDGGFDKEAGAVGTLYEALVKMNFITMAHPLGKPAKRSKKAAAVAAE